MSTVLFSDIHIGSSAALSGPSKEMGTYYLGGAQLYFDAINRDGGVNGENLVFTVYDDGYEPDRTIKNTIRLIEEDGVEALFGYVGTPTVTRILPLLKLYQDKKVPLYFPLTGAQVLRAPRYTQFVYNLRPSYHHEIDHIVKQFHQINRRRIALFYQSDAFGRDGWVGARRSTTRYGSDLVADVSYRRGASNTDSFDKQISIISEAQSDLIICVGAYEAVSGFIRQLRERGIDLPVVVLSFTSPSSLSEHIALTGNNTDPLKNVIVSQVIPRFDSNLPVARDFRRELTTQNKGHLLNELSFEGYLAAMLFVEMKRAPNRKEYDIGLNQSIQLRSKAHRLTTVYFNYYDNGAWHPIKDWSLWKK